MKTRQNALPTLEKVKAYKLGSLNITAEFVGWSLPDEWESDHKRPEYSITITAPGGREHRARAWGNIMGLENVEKLVKIARETSTREMVSFIYRTYKPARHEREQYMRLMDGYMYGTAGLKQKLFKIYGKESQHASLTALVISELAEDPGNYPDFCANFGYEEDSRKAFKIYNILAEGYAGGYWLDYLKGVNLEKLRDGETGALREVEAPAQD
jgi:hypothetical protein